jgi:hypothetical protein
MAISSGDESPVDYQTIKDKLTVPEKSFVLKFKGNIQEAKNIIANWLDISKEYQNHTRDALSEHYTVMKDHIIDMLNNNKLESRKHSKLLQKLMSGRRQDFRSIWHKERLNYRQLDLLLQMKVDEESFKKVMAETTLMQNTAHEGLDLDKEAGGIEKLVS